MKILGDIHSNFDEIKRIFNIKYSTKKEMNKIDEKVISCGDIFDRGLNSYETYKFINFLDEKNKFELVLGNHDIFFMMAFAKWSSIKTKINALSLMFINGGKDTLMGLLKSGKLNGKFDFIKYKTKPCGISLPDNEQYAYNFINNLLEEVKFGNLGYYYNTLYKNKKIKRIVNIMEKGSLYTTINKSIIIHGGLPTFQGYTVDLGYIDELNKILKKLINGEDFNNKELLEESLLSGGYASYNPVLYKIINELSFKNINISNTNIILPYRYLGRTYYNENNSLSISNYLHKKGYNELIIGHDNEKNGIKQEISLNNKNKFNIYHLDDSNNEKIGYLNR